MPKKTDTPKLQIVSKNGTQSKNIKKATSKNVQKVQPKQSLYENYSDTSKNYDIMRIPVGMDIIKKQIKNIKQAVVLDCGAGTGNQAFALCDSVK